MAVSHLLPSPSLPYTRTIQVCLHLHSVSVRKSMTCFHISAQKQKGVFKLDMVTSRTDAHHVVLKPFAPVGSVDIESDMANQENHISSGVTEPDEIQRENPLLDLSPDPLDGVKDFERELQELFNEVKSMIMKGNQNNAVDLLQANYEAVIEQMNTGAKGIEEAAILDVITLGYMAIGDLKFVSSLLILLSEIVSNLSDDEPLLDSVLVHMGSMYSNLGKFDKSMLMYQRAIDILESKYGKSSTLLVTPLFGMAKVLGSTGRVTKAVGAYHRVITILESSRGTESKDLVIPLLGLGNLLIKGGRAADAESAFTRILRIYTKIYGERDGRVGIAMCSLAHAKCAKGNADEAIHLYKNALKVIKDSNYVGLDDSVMENMRIDLAELLHVVGRGKEGRELLAECLLINEKYKGKDHLTSVPHLLNLATSYSSSKDFVEAERLLRTSLKIMMENVGPDDQSITFPMLHLAVTLYHLNQNEEAEQLALEVLHIREKAFGENSLPVGEALDCLVAIRTRQGKDDGELLEMLKKVLRIQEQEFGSESEEVVVTLNKIVYYLDKLGRKDEKLLLKKRLSMLRTKYNQTIHY